MSQGISYPSNNKYKRDWHLGRGFSSGNVLAPFSRLINGNSDEMIKTLSKVWQELHSEESEKVLVSAENLSAYAVHNFFWQQLHDFCIESGQLPKVVLFLRDPLAALISYFEQEVKNAGECRTFGDWFTEVHEIGLNGIAIYPLLHNAISSAENYGISLNIYTFEKSKNNLINYFWQEILSLNTDPEPESMVINPSLSRLDVDFFRGMNSVSSKFGKLIGYDKTDMWLATKHVSSSYSHQRLFPYEISEQENKILRSFLTKCTENMRLIKSWSIEDEIQAKILNLDYSNTNQTLSPFVATSLRAEQRDLSTYLFELGSTLGESFKSGYLDRHIRHLAKDSRSIT